MRHAEPIRLPEPPTAPTPRTIEPGSLGPLDMMLEEPGVLEIVCEGPSHISMDRGTGLVGAAAKFPSEAALTGAVARLFAMAGATVPAERGGVHEATMPDGTHVLAVMPPVAVGGPYVEIRRLGRPAVTGESLVSQGVLSADMLGTLRSAVAVRRNIIVLGPSDAGVSAIVSVLASAIHADERIATIEASPEIALPSGRAIRLVGGAGGLGTLLSRAAAIRVDRVVIDGVGGPDLRAAMVLLATRSGGGILGVRAYAPGPTLAQLEALASLSGGASGLAALVGSVAHVVVRMGRGADGVRRVESIAEIGNEGLVELFEHGDGGFASTGARPSFLG